MLFKYFREKKWRKAAILTQYYLCRKRYIDFQENR
jgi:hypothetical protein